MQVNVTMCASLILFVQANCKAINLEINTIRRESKDTFDVQLWETSGAGMTAIEFKQKLLKVGRDTTNSVCSQFGTGVKYSLLKGKCTKTHAHALTHMQRQNKLQLLLPFLWRTLDP